MRRSLALYETTGALVTTAQVKLPPKLVPVFEGDPSEGRTLWCR